MRNGDIAVRISIHSPHARGDLSKTGLTSQHAISIHSPHARGDPLSHVYVHRAKYFNPLPSCEGRPAARMREISGLMISIHSPHARGDNIGVTTNQQMIISIHSPHARGDKRNADSDRVTCRFQSTPLMRGETHGCMYSNINDAVFQSTPLMRGETSRLIAILRRLCDFNPLPSCEGRLAHA